MPSGLFGFPNPVNEPASRLVAGAVALIACAAIATQQPWLSAVLAYGFLARVATGPTMSPLGQLATRVVAPRLTKAPKLVPGPPKRFAQGIGATVSCAATLCFFLGHLVIVTYALLGLLALAAALEAAFAFCIGCRVFGLLMRWGVIPQEVCVACARLPAREGRTP
ncbi:MAG: DUF4395 domain-containing protein [Candidatus Dormibacteraeota bacterium]|jgi:hypothetical protein|nr:DUF4395 domain-containing protein [Candidatus Dormibacteraeota bacterium]